MRIETHPLLGPANSSAAKKIQYGNSESPIRHKFPDRRVSRPSYPPRLFLYLSQKGTLSLHIFADMPPSAPGAPDAFPTSSHNFLISFLQATHSLKRCSLVYLADPHHQHMSDSIQPNFSLMNGAVIACPDANWKKRDTTSFGALLGSTGVLGTSPSTGNLSTRLPLHLLMISSLHSSTAFPFLSTFKRPD